MVKTEFLTAKVPWCGFLISEHGPYLRIAEKVALGSAIKGVLTRSNRTGGTLGFWGRQIKGNVNTQFLTIKG